MSLRRASSRTPRGGRFANGQLVVVNPYVACGRCHACRKGLPNACMRIGVLGVHRDGGMCEEICLPEENLIPAGNLSPDEAASVEFLAIGAHAVRRSGLKSGERALIVGAGPIGLGTALFAKLAGGEVTVLDRDASRLTFAADAANVDQTLLADGDVDALIAKATQGDGFDVVFDATGSRSSMEASFAYTAHGGRYVLVGLVKDAISFLDPGIPQARNDAARQPQRHVGRFFHGDRGDHDEACADRQADHAPHHP